MKVLSVALISLFSTITFASGFVCQGQGYNVKLYNEVQPSMGTRNPAVLVVSSERGTIARLLGTDIQRYVSNDTVTFEGHNNSVDTGRFLKVSLTVAKQAEASGDFAGMHYARLVINADNGTWTANLACAEYLKGQN